MSDQTTDDDFSSVTVDDLKALRRQRDSERDARIAADQARQRAERERDEARGNAGNEAVARFNAEEQAVESAINSANAEAEALTERIAQLNAEGSFSEAAKAHRALARAEAQIAQLSMRKDYLANVKTQAQQPQPQRQDPYAGFSAKQRAWAEAHPLYLDTSTAESRRLTSRVNAAHHFAVADDIPVDSDEYFERLTEAAEGDSGSRRRSRDNDDDAPAPRSHAAMPVTRRGVDGGNGRDSGPVRLSPEMREMADISFPDVPVDDHVVNGVTMPGRYRQYANHMARLKSEGRM